MSNDPYTLRLAGEDDDLSIRRLAELDSRPEPARPALLAEVDGDPVAALSLDDSTVVADPFRPTADAVGLLEARARIMHGTGPRRGQHLDSIIGLLPRQG